MKFNEIDDKIHNNIKEVKKTWAAIWDVDLPHRHVVGFKNKLKQKTLYVLRIIIASGIKFYRDNGLNYAAALTFTSLLSLIPTVTVALTIFSAFPAFEEVEDTVVEAIFDIVLPNIDVENLTESLASDDEKIPDETENETLEIIIPEDTQLIVPENTDGEAFQDEDITFSDGEDDSESLILQPDQSANGFSILTQMQDEGDVEDEEGDGSAKSQIKEILDDFRDSATSLGILSLVMVFFTATSVFRTMENSLNYFWRIKTRRRFLDTFISFWSVLTLGPIIFGISIYLVFGMGESSFLYGTFVYSVIKFFFPFLVTVLGFFFIYLLLPNTYVKRKNAIIGALTSGFLFEIGKASFAFYTNFLSGEKYHIIYGASFLIPIFLLWIYISFIFVLFGSVVSFIAQHPDRFYLDKYGKLREIDSFLGTYRFYNYLTILCSMYSHFDKSKGYLSEKEISNIANINPQQVSNSIKFLERKNVVTKVLKEKTNIYVFMHPPQKFTLQDILDLVIDDPLDIPPQIQGIYREKLEEVITQYQEISSDILSKITIADFSQYLEKANT